jgi:hypothetical protein
MFNVLILIMLAIIGLPVISWAVPCIQHCATKWRIWTLRWRIKALKEVRRCEKRFIAWKTKMLAVERMIFEEETKFAAWLQEAMLDRCLT